MKKITKLFFFHFLLWGTCSLCAQDIKVSFYNVQNFFDLTHNKTEYSSYIPNKHNWGLETFRKKRENIAHVISKIQADIIALAEMENPNALRLLLKKGALDKEYTHTLFARSNSKSPTGLALLSKYPIITSSVHAIDFPDSFETRPILQATIKTSSENIILFINHWPSKKNPEKRRVYCAKIIDSLTRQLPKDTKYLVIGDLNSHFNEYDYNPFETTGINSILNTGIIYKNRFIPWSYKDLITSSNKLYNPWIECTDEIQWSYIYKGEKSTLDHILVSSTLLNNKEGLCYKINSFTPETVNSAIITEGKPFRWEVINTKDGPHHTGEGYSDHLPISILLTQGQSSNKAVPSLHHDGFELSREGWYTVSDNFTINRTVIPDSVKNMALHIKGQSRKNATAVEKNLHIPPNAKGITLKLIGKGDFYFRYTYDKKKWLYTDLKGKIKKSGRYEKFSSSCWQEISFNITSQKDNGVTLQIRSHANTTMDLYIDGVSFVY